MHRNRIFAAKEVRLSQPREPVIRPDTFIAVPVNVLPGVRPEVWLWQQWVYRVAFEQAQAVVRPSILDSDLLGVWN
jgi:hypothetical protein